MSSPSSSRDARLARVDELLAAVISEHSSHGRLDHRELIALHPELMPELAERLSTLGAIYSAAEVARTSADDEPERRRAEQIELEFLRSALPGYEILAPIHRGGQGIVYKAIQRSTDRIVALKVPLGGPLVSRSQTDRFAREVKLIAELNHPNIVTLYEAGVVHGRRYFSMAFVEGIPVDDYVLVHDLSVKDTVRLMIEVARAAHYAHTTGIVHRDLKPANVLVDSDGRPHILDFGLARAADADDDSRVLSLPGAPIGTLPYMSPEQAAGTVPADYRSDTYTLAVVLYELLTGTFPYPLQGSAEQMRRTILETPPRPARRALAATRSPDDPPRAIGHDLEAILLKALRKEPMHRYNSAAALADDLERHLRGEIVEARVDAKYYLLATTLRKHRIAALFAATFVVMLIASLIGVSLAWRHAERAAKIARGGLEMAGHVRLGSVARDSGRVDQAVMLLESAAQIGERLETDDPIVQRYLFDACDRLSRLYRKAGRTAEADARAETAIRLAERLIRQDPQNPEWRRMHAISWMLRAEVELSRNALDRAVEAYDGAVSAFAALHDENRGNATLTHDLASSRIQRGTAHQRLGQMSAAFEDYRAAQELTAAALELDPRDAENWLFCVAAENNIAQWFMRQKTPDDDRAALEWLDLAERHLRHLDDTPEIEFRSADIATHRSAIEKNRRIIAARSGP